VVSKDRKIEGSVLTTMMLIAGYVIFFGTDEPGSGSSLESETPVPFVRQLFNFRCYETICAEIS
jgi:hypothetical protein